VSVSKGDLDGQRQRRRDRYRGCRICGVRGEQCLQCGGAEQLVALHGYAHLTLVVDGSFVPHDRGVRRSSGWGGAGLVLVRGGIRGEILASRACGFLAETSTDAERHAIIRGARWAPGVVIYTDQRDLPDLLGIPTLDVQYLPAGQRTAAHDLAHRLSVEGRSRDAPPEAQTDLEITDLRANLTKHERKQAGVAILLAHARLDPAFDGNFVKIAERLGWTSGRFWRDNPAIRIATEIWTSTSGAAASGCP
jgi:hypothetical protein